MVKRENFTFGIKEIDDILFSHTGIGSYVLYQESIMLMLSYAGIDKKETYTILKAISKKKEDIIKKAKEHFINGIVSKVSKKVSEQRANEIAKQIWKVIEDASAYSFNAPHSLSVSLDSLYIADAKVKYKQDTYCELLDYYSFGKKRKISKTAECKRELERIGEKVNDIKLGYVSNKTLYTEDGYIQNILSVKGINEKLANYLKDIDKNTHPLELYFNMKDTRINGVSVGDKRSITALSKMRFFSNICSSKKVMEYAPKLYDMIYSKKQFRDISLQKLYDEFKVEFDINKYISRKTAKTYYLDENKKMDMCIDIFNMLPDEDFSIIESAINEVKSFGYLVNPSEYKDYKIFDGMIKAVSLKEKSIILVSHTTGSELKVFMKSLQGIKKKINILILGAKIRANRVNCDNFITYV